MHIPDNLAEPITTFVRLCRNAEEGERIDVIKKRLEAEHPELGPEQVKDVIHRGARLFVEKTEEQDPTLARQARNRLKEGKKNG